MVKVGREILVRNQPLGGISPNVRLLSRGNIYEVGRISDSFSMRGPHPGRRKILSGRWRVWGVGGWGSLYNTLRGGTIPTNMVCLCCAYFQARHALDKHFGLRFAENINGAVLLCHTVFLLRTRRNSGTETISTTLTDPCVAHTVHGCFHSVSVPGCRCDTVVLVLGGSHVMCIFGDIRC